MVSGERETDGTHRCYLRARVLMDLVDVIGKREVKKSLGTSDRQEALEQIDSNAAEAVETSPRQGGSDYRDVAPEER